MCTDPGNNPYAGLRSGFGARFLKQIRTVWGMVHSGGSKLLESQPLVIGQKLYKDRGLAGMNLIKYREWKEGKKRRSYQRWMCSN